MHRGNGPLGRSTMRRWMHVISHVATMCLTNESVAGLAEFLPLVELLLSLLDKDAEFISTGMRDDSLEEKPRIKEQKV